MVTASQTMQIRKATVGEVVPLACALFTEHHEEIKFCKQAAKLNIDVAKYEALEANGSLLTLVVTNDGGVLIGYSVNFMLTHPHYSDLKIAMNDLLFITKEHRRGRLGLRLIKATEKEAKKMGAKFLIWAAKPNSTFAKLLTHLGCDVEENIFSQEL